MRKTQLYEQLFSIQNLLWSFSSRNKDFQLNLIENHCYATLEDRYLQQNVVFRSIYEISKSDFWFIISVRPTAKPVTLNQAPTGRIFMKFYIRIFFGNLSKMFNYNLTKIKGILLENQYMCTFLIISRSLLLRMRNVSEEC